MLIIDEKLYHRSSSSDISAFVLSLAELVGSLPNIQEVPVPQGVVAAGDKDFKGVNAFDWRCVENVSDIASFDGEGDVAELVVC